MARAGARGTSAALCGHHHNSRRAVRGRESARYGMWGLPAPPRPGDSPAAPPANPALVFYHFGSVTDFCWPRSRVERPATGRRTAGCLDGPRFVAGAGVTLPGRSSSGPGCRPRPRAGGEISGAHVDAVAARAGAFPAGAVAGACHDRGTRRDVRFHPLDGSLRGRDRARTRRPLLWFCQLAGHNSTKDRTARSTVRPGAAARRAVWTRPAFGVGDDERGQRDN